jgi:hypothetical protein
MRFIPLVILFSSACGPRPPEPGQPGECGTPPIAFSPSGDVVFGKDDDTGACARMERRDAREPDVICKACPYDPIRLTAAAGDHFVDVTDASALTYLPTHHNWADEMTGTNDGVTAKVRLLYGVEDADWRLELTFFEGDTALIGPLLLVP